MIQAGLRIDVDTLRGTRLGVPNLLRLLAQHQVRASVFFSVGPDNMGRHVWRLWRPAFLAKMLRTRAARLYGWEVVLRGTLGPGPLIGQHCPEIIRQTAEAGHEVGLHSWDHYRWQTHVHRMTPAALKKQIEQGADFLTELLGRPPTCFAAPGWRTTPGALQVLDTFPFQYGSDCRGHAIFRPLVGGQALHHCQVPTTLPTYDEVVGLTCTPETYNGYLLDLVRPDRLNVLTIHAEAEGISCLPHFQEFLAQARRRTIAFIPLSSLLTRTPTIPEATIRRSKVAGREGWVACQDVPNPAPAPASSRATGS